MINIRASDLFTKPKKSKRRLYVILGILITGFLSLVFIFVTIYGQYTGNYLITLTKDAVNKGISISDNEEFEKSNQRSLKIQPLDFTDDTEWVEFAPYLTAIEEHEGQYFLENAEDQHFIAYTFYLKNIGEEVVNLDYVIWIIDDYKNLGNGTAFWVKRSLMKDGVATDPYEKLYSKAYTNNDIIAEESLTEFSPNQMYKFTFIVWLNGPIEDFGFATNSDMIGGAIKLEWAFKISSAE